MEITDFYTNFHIKYGLVVNFIYYTCKKKNWQYLPYRWFATHKK